METDPTTFFHFSSSSNMITIINVIKSSSNHIPNLVTVIIYIASNMFFFVMVKVGGTYVVTLHTWAPIHNYTLQGL